MAKAQLHEIRIRPSKGGVAVETEHRTKRSGQGGGPLVDYDSEPSVHTTMESLRAHLDEHLGHVFEAQEKTPADGKEHEPD